MCGRYAIKAEPETIRSAFDLPYIPEILPRYNVAPTQMVPVVRLDEASNTRSLSLLKWGLIPSWSKDESTGNGMINARAETVSEKPAFRSAFKKRRCLFVADGFYEWKTEKSGKLPYFFQLKDGSPFAIAGLWEWWEKEQIESCALITTEANGVVGPVHDRMPVILKPVDYAQWLDPKEQRASDLQKLLAPLPNDWMTARPVSKAVNNPRNEGPQCIE